MGRDSSERRKGLRWVKTDKYRLTSGAQWESYQGWSGGEKTKHNTSLVEVVRLSGGQKPYRTIRGKGGCTETGGVEGALSDS
jgi:hypothetical protein